MFGLSTRRYNNGLFNYDPFRELEEMERRFVSASPAALAFGTDIAEEEGGYKLMADLPGFNKEDIHVDVDGDRLTISAERGNENEEKNMTFAKYKSQIENHGQEQLKDLDLNLLTFIKARETFHDRFIFLINDEKIIGYQIGTSLNSFGTNYSNIIKLNDYCAKIIFDILYENILSENISKLEG